MSSKRNTEAFNVEAVRQVTDRGHSVADVAGRLGIDENGVENGVRLTSRRSSRLQPDVHSYLDVATCA